jgi:hypothetical protein
LLRLNAQDKGGASAPPLNTVNRSTHIAGGLHVPFLTRHVAMPKGAVPAPNGDPATGAKAPLFASMV